MSHATDPRPFMFVLAGVNGAGKSSVVGALLEQHGLAWFDLDSYARQLRQLLAMSMQESVDRAWLAGRQRFDAALANGSNYAFETTLGDNSIIEPMVQAAATHRVVMMFMGLGSADQHVARVKRRVAGGGHDIPEQTIRERWMTSRINLISLLPHLSQLQVFDNSADMKGEGTPDPSLVLEVASSKVLAPKATDAKAMSATPEWARAIVEAALERSAGGS